MKKVLFFTSLLANMVFFLLACQKEQVTKPTQKLLTETYRTAHRSSDAANSSCTGASPSMPYSLVRDMLSNYRSKQQRSIESNLNIKDANSCWFDLATIKNFICHLEEKVSLDKNPTIANLGLRFYYGAHGNNPTAYDLPANYARLHNLVIIPTYRNVDGSNIDFDPDKIDMATSKPLPLNLNRTDSTGGVPPGNSDIFALDHGQLGPPY